jgi:hypothetical protein
VCLSSTLDGELSRALFLSVALACISPWYLVTFQYMLAL